MAIPTVLLSQNCSSAFVCPFVDVVRIGGICTMLNLFPKSLKPFGGIMGPDGDGFKTELVSKQR